MHDPNPTLKLAQERLKIAQEHYVALSGGQSACLISKNGLENEDLKRVEGQMIALQDAVKALRRTASGPETITIMESLKGRWEALPELSKAWQAYKSAGLSELQQLLNYSESEWREKRF